MRDGFTLFESIFALLAGAEVSATNIELFLGGTFSCDRESDMGRSCWFGLEFGLGIRGGGPRGFGIETN